VNVPPPVEAVVRALDLTEPDRDGLHELGARDWETALDFLDRNQMTLVFGAACESELPDDVRARIAADREKNRQRLGNLRAEYESIRSTLAHDSVDHALLKGFSHGAEYLPRPELRPQYDLDLLVPPKKIEQASRAVQALGFESVTPQSGAPVDHLPPLVRKTGWEWRGDYFDPEIPPVVELHHRLWDAETEGFPAPGVETFWERRRDGYLDPVDRLAYAALHLLRHLLRGSVKLLHVYELAWFVHAEHEERFWGRRAKLQSAELRQAQNFALALAAAWFQPRLPPPLIGELSALPPRIQTWFEEYRWAPLEAQFHPVKSEIWLHLELLDSRSKRRRAIRRKLLPATLPGPIEGQFGARPSPLGRAWRYARHLATRTLRHTRALWRLTADARRWRKAKNS